MINKVDRVKKHGSLGGYNHAGSCRLGEVCYVGRSSAALEATKGAIQSLDTVGTKGRERCTKFARDKCLHNPYIR